MDDVVVTKVVTAQVKSLESLLQELQSAVCVGILVLLRGLSFFSFSWHAIIMTVILQIKIGNTCRKNDENTIEGPSLNDLYGPFDILSELDIQNSINFSSGENISFDMELSKRTN